MAESTLTQLRDQIEALEAQAEPLRVERNQAIRDAVEAGTPIAQVARDAGLTRRAVYLIVSK
ncbi:hypothetical protein [Kocuria sp.]|uniref:hypothetical protein n=1 Tax=Kocuria sp. TaxID=1871328 RepID=UPI0026DF3136|nr:hypothetical protein [Kocuria sp.]MDO5619311.1 hypothetical protein [Kocuria sp.]